MTKITAHFHNLDNIFCAVSSIRLCLEIKSEIRIGCISSLDHCIFRQCFMSFFSGCVSGVLTGFSICIFLSSGVFYDFFIVGGLICGGTLGAVIGCIADLKNFSRYKKLMYISFYIPHKDKAKAVKYLKQLGAYESVIQKTADLQQE